MRTCILFIVTCFLIFGCSNAPTGEAKIPGFSPVSDMIPDWESRRQKSFRTFYKNKDGKESSGFTTEKFMCKNAENRSYSLVETPTGQLMPAIVEESPLEIPEDLREVLTELVNKIENGKFQDKGGMILYHARNLPVDFLKFDDGWLVAYARGEWGGILLWIEPSGDVRILSEDNTNDLLLHNGKFYAAQGDNHMFTDPENILMLTKKGNGFRKEIIPSPSAVYQLDALNGKIVGLLSDGIIYIEEDDTVHFNRLNYRDLIGFRPKRVGFLSTGEIYIAGNNMIGIYPALPSLRQIDLYIPNDCVVFFSNNVNF